MTELGHTYAAESLDEVENRAADFLQRRRLLRWNSIDQAELDTWLGEATSHRVAFLRLEASVTRVERAVEPRPPRLDRATGRARFHAAVPVLPIAASLALIVALGFAAERFLERPSDHTYSTEVGGRTLVSFADHTQIELNTNTVLRYRMTTAERTVWLEKGEAWFHVAHDAAHPFSVIVGRHRVADLGTEFLVRRGGEDIEVALLNGRATLSTEGAQTATLSPGDDAVATPVSVSVTRKTPQQLTDELAWRRGVLVFRKTKLTDVVREFNRYNTTRLVIADPSIANVEITADLKTDDYEDFLNLAQTVLNLRADRKGNDILISRAQRNETKRAVHPRHSN